MYDLLQELEYEIYVYNYTEETDDNMLTIEEYFEQKELNEEMVIT